MTQAIEKRRNEGIDVFGTDFELAQRVGKALASSPFVPEQLRDVGSCMIAIDLANRLGASPLAVMQNMYVVYGRPAFEAKFIISCINTCGRFTRLKFRDNGKNGDAYGVYAIAKDLSTGEELKGTTITLEMVKSEGWYDKKGSKWRTMPEQMFKYRAASFWKNEHAPEITMGIPTRDETDDIHAEDAEIVDVKTIDDVTEINKQKVRELNKNESVTVEDPMITKEKQELGDLQFRAIDLSKQLFGDDKYLPELSKLCRNAPGGKFGITSATKEQAQWAINELSDMLAAKEQEKE